MVEKKDQFKLATYLLEDDYLFPVNSTKKPLGERSETHKEAWPIFIEMIECFVPPAVVRLRQHSNQLFTVKNTTHQDPKSGLYSIAFESLPVSEIEIKEKLRQNPFENMWLLRDSVSAVFIDELLKYNKSLSLLPLDDLRIKKYHRIQELILKLTHGAFEKIEIKDRVPSFMSRGLRTGVFVSFDFLRAIPLAFHRATGKIIEPAHFLKLAKEARPLLFTISGMHLDAFTNLRSVFKSVDFIKDPATDPQKIIDYSLPARLFIYDAKIDKISIDLNCIHEWRKEFENSGGLPRTGTLGCPARTASTTTINGKSIVIFEVYNAITDFFYQYMSEHFAAYINCAPAELK